MRFIARFPIGVYFLSLAVALQFSPILFYMFRGAWGSLTLVLIGVFSLLPTVQGKDFINEVIQAIRNNGGIVFLLLMYYIMVVVSWFHTPYETPPDELHLVMKQNLLEVIYILVILFFSRNPRYFSVLVICIFPIAIFQMFAFRFVSDKTGMDARDLLSESGAMGTTSNWQAIAMYAFALTGLAFKSHRKILICIAISTLLLLAKVVLSAGFATPFALFVIGFFTLGIGYLLYGGRGKMAFFSRILFATIAIIGSVYLVKSVIDSLGSGDEVSKGVSWRIKNVLEDPMSGGYSEENSRFSGMRIGWDSFCSSPLFGRGGSYPTSLYITSGGHHSIVDYLAHFGLMGGGAYLLFVLIVLLRCAKRCRITRDMGSVCVLAVAIMYFVSGIVNPMWRGVAMLSFISFCNPFTKCDESRRKNPRAWNNGAWQQNYYRWG